MKRIQVRPGKFVTISDALAAKAERAFASISTSRDEAERLVRLEPRGTTIYAGEIAGKHAKRKIFRARSTKPLPDNRE